MRRILLRIAGSSGVIFLVALTMRVWALTQLLPQKAWEYFYRYIEPARIAWAMVSGFGYSSPWPNTPLAATAQQPPVYPLIVAGVFKLAGAYSYRSLWIAVGLNAVLSSLTAVMILRVGKRDFGSLTGVLAAWVWACWMYEAVVAVRLWESSLSALLLMVALLVLPKLKAANTSLWLLFGLLAAVGSLTNTTLLSVFPFFWIWLWVSNRRSGRSCWKLVLASAGVFLLALLPWTIRNYEVFHRLIPLRDNFGLELWIGNHQGVTHQFDSDFPILDPSEYNRLGEIRFMESKRDIALQFIGQHPVEFLQLSLRRCLRYWTAPDPVVWSFVSLMAWSGMILALRRKGMEAIPYAIVLLMFPLIYYITHTFNSYRHPTEPVMFLLAAYASVTLLEWLARRPRATSSHSS
ncbi:MAG: glycosyltransferase family 39 protein [Terriglobales bacterium]